ncbi:MAG: PIN domain-containing protein [Thermodesulfovibrionales bacterium]|nr:PIN domain-containing protein [Nitrospinota bacterium]MCG2710354.1 PIN domain-containing protein [Thermodesulfovibrionales bacterium]
MKKPERSLPDTNTIVRYLVADDPVLHAKAKDFFDKVKHGSLKTVILESVIAECIYVLTKIYKVPRVRAAGSLIDLMRYKGIANDDQQELIRALSLFSERGIDIVDCILCAKAATSEDHLFTFDEDLQKLSRRA